MQMIQRIKTLGDNNKERYDMNENLPPPHWSPSGNSGTWYWDESKTIACWKWADDEQPLELLASEETNTKPSWVELIKKFIKKQKGKYNG